MIELAPEPATALGQAVHLMDRVAAALQRGHVAYDSVTRPNPWLVVAWRMAVAHEQGEPQRQCVVFAPAAVWDGPRDIYDALTASDRPCKKALPIEHALDILHRNVKDGHLDGELVRMFVQAQIWKRTASGQP